MHTFLIFNLFPALHGRLEVVEFLLDHCDYKVDEKDSCGSTPLMDAARAGFTQVCHKSSDDVCTCFVLVHIMIIILEDRIVSTVNMFEAFIHYNANNK